MVKDLAPVDQLLHLGWVTIWGPIPVADFKAVTDTAFAIAFEH